MSVDEISRVNLFLTIALPLLPVLWIVLGLQTTWVRENLENAVKFWERHGGKRRSQGNFRATAWSSAVALCFGFGAGIEALALVGILFGWEGIKLLASTLLLIPLLLSLGLIAWSLMRLVAAFSSGEPPDTREP